MKVLLLLALSNGALGAALTDAERATLTAAARSSPTTWGSQQAVDMTSRLGKEGNLEALDLLLSLHHAPLLGVYMGRFREAHRNEPVPAIEQRLLANYDDPRIAMELIRGLDRYAAKPLFERLLADASQLAAFYVDESKRCRLVTAKAPAPQGPQTPQMGQTPQMAQTPQMPPLAQMQARSSISAIQGMMVARPPTLECDGVVPSNSPERMRMVEAVRIIGKTDLPEAAKRLQPVFAGLGASPPVEGEVPAMQASSLAASRLVDLQSVAELWGRQRYLAAAPALIVAARRVPMRTLQDARAVWPLLQALGQMDLREGSETIAEWIDRRSSGRASLTESPTLAEMIRLLGPVLPEGQIEVVALRERVLPRVPPQSQLECANAFKAVETMNGNLRQPTEASFVAWARMNDRRMVRYVLSKAISPNGRDAEGETALTATWANFDMQRFLVDAGADPDAPGRGGMTPFHLAVGWFSPARPEPYKVVDYFFSKKADVNSAAMQGTPLITASERSPEMVKYLLERGARVDAATREGMTPLHGAARSGKASSARMLLDAGASVNAPDRDGMMPLHLAVRSRNVEIAEMLLERGADVNAEIQDGMTPLQMAHDGNDPAMQALLERGGGRVNAANAAKRAALKKLMESQVAPR